MTQKEERVHEQGNDNQRNVGESKTDDEDELFEDPVIEEVDDTVDTLDTQQEVTPAAEPSPPCQNFP